MHKQFHRNKVADMNVEMGLEWRSGVLLLLVLGSSLSQFEAWQSYFWVSLPNFPRALALFQENANVARGEIDVQVRPNSNSNFTSLPRKDCRFGAGGVRDTCLLVMCTSIAFAAWDGLVVVALILFVVWILGLAHVYTIPTHGLVHVFIALAIIFVIAWIFMRCCGRRRTAQPAVV
ncbi:uncharacterized protein VTP21DRAFT_5427 [Calcarisporiella thermophila]|uniref:uncharacterized protein n=1 Tax=Calcarisporiella thermophila TaxID=911321 RepID=UPI0037427860